jgi:hypothetical protein
LTYSLKDKLAAISAIVKRIGRNLSSVYYTGLFEKELPLGLLWVPSRSDPRTAIQYRAPSWSWASINISMGPTPDLDGIGPYERYMFSIETVKVKLADPSNQYGPIESAELRVTGLLHFIKPFSTVDLFVSGTTKFWLYPSRND